MTPEVKVKKVVVQQLKDMGFTSLAAAEQAAQEAEAEAVKLEAEFEKAYNDFTTTWAGKLQ